MKINKDKKEERILARVMSRELTEKQLNSITGAGTCTLRGDGDLANQISIGGTYE